jgi:hypothetical protein
MGDRSSCSDDRSGYGADRDPDREQVRAGLVTAQTWIPIEVGGFHRMGSLPRWSDDFGSHVLIETFER